LSITFCKLALADYETLSADLLRACLAKRLFKYMCFLVFCKMKMSIREATLNLHPASYREPCKPVLSGVEVSARIAPWLAVMQRCEHIA
jgi:hypothetical protein